MSEFLIILIKSSFSMSIVALIYMASTPIVSKRYAAKWRYYAWLIIVLGLIIPFRLHIDIPIVERNAVENPIELAFVESDEKAQVNQLGMPTSEFLQTSEKGNDKTVQESNLVTNQPQSIPWYFWCIGLWITGVVVFTGYHIMTHRRFLNLVKRWGEDILDEDISDIVLNLQLELGITKQACIKQCACVTSPMMIGFRKPIILIPSKDISIKELTFILKHELVHYKRKDLWYKSLILIATVIHWFNPVIYIMAKAIAVECEISCDDEVIKDTDLDQKLQYSETIISVIGKRSYMKTSFSTNFLGGKRSMRNRIFAIMNTGRKKVGIIIFCILGACVLMTGANFTENTIDNQDKSTSAGNGKDSTMSETQDSDYMSKYESLLNLMYKGYNDMSISEYRNKVRNSIGEYEQVYQKQLEQLIQDTKINSICDQDSNADFLVNILMPILTDKWAEREYSKSIQSNNAIVEYGYSYTILNTEKLKVGELINTINQLDSSIQSSLDVSSPEANSEKVIQSNLELEARKVAKEYSNKNIEIKNTFLSYRKTGNDQLSEVNNSIDGYNSEEYTTQATEQDYDMLLSLMVDGYKNMSLTDYEKEVSTFLNDEMHSAAYERIEQDLFLGNESKDLSMTERTFFNTTLSATISELDASYQQQFTDEEMLPSLKGLAQRRENADEEGVGETVVFEVTADYQLTYRITDGKKVTVDERDRAITSIMSGIQQYLDNKSINELAGGKASLQKEINRLTKKNSNEWISFEVKNLIHDVIDDRNIQ
jgi:beta-lactamase regulating signal transducer with metallopeptidase domain